jgi:hypothetical protein
MKLFALALLLSTVALAQDAPQAPTAFLLYRNAQGCLNLESLNLPGFVDCQQMVNVIAVSPDPTVKSFAVMIAYVDAAGHRQIQTQPPVAANVNDGKAVASVVFFNVNNITDLSTTVVDDAARNATVKQ